MQPTVVQVEMPDGMRLVGKLDLGNGLVGMIDGRIKNVAPEVIRTK